MSSAEYIPLKTYFKEIACVVSVKCDQENELYMLLGGEGRLLLRGGRKPWGVWSP